MSLRKQFILLMIFPIIGLLLVSGYLGLVQLQSVRAANYTDAQIRDMSALSKLVHVLQVERGLSAGFVASRGGNFADRLPAARAAVDRAEQGIPDWARELSRDIAMLEDTRLAVDRLTVSVPQVAETYTELVRHALSFSERALFDQNDASVALVGAGLVALGEAKEAAGLQRATGAGGFGSGSFSSDLFKRFIALQAIEDTQLATAQKELSILVADFDLTDALETSRVGEFRDAVLAAGPNVDIAGFSAPEWFARSSDWIERLHAKELSTLDFANTLSAKNGFRAKMLLSFAVIISLAALVASMTMAWRALKSFERDFSRLTRAVARLAQRDFTNKGKERNQDTEIGRLFIAIDETRDLMGSEDQIARKVEQERQQVLAELDEALVALSKGDLTHQINSAFPQEYEQLRSVFNHALIKLQGAIEKVSISVGEVEKSGAQLSESNADLSQRTASQAAALEQMTAATSELSSSVKETATKATEANEIAKVLRSEATTGLDEIANAKQAMAQITKGALEASNMVEVIEAIAFQTNLLALNAGVEAARAGDAGAGFAVIASEVRALAVNATDATKEIGKTIRTSNEIVESGTSVVERAGDAFQTIFEGVQRTSTAVEQIANDSQEQSSGFVELKVAMVELDRVTQGNSAMVESSAQESERLAREAAILSELVEDFQLPQSTVIFNKSAA